MIMKPTPMSPELAEAIEKARALPPMTASERSEQMVSFVYGQQAMTTQPDSADGLHDDIWNAGYQQGIADERARLLSDEAVERAWDALRERTCSDPKTAKRCVMVSQDDLRAAIAAAVGEG